MAWNDQLEKGRARLDAFLKARPHLNRKQFSLRADVHRNTLYGDPEKWNWDTVGKCLEVVKQIEQEEAKVQRKSRPSRQPLYATV